MPLSETSYSRHISYCRKTQNRPRIRKKACKACNSAKSKCDFSVPCQRCALKGYECSYEEPSRKVATVQRHRSIRVLKSPLAELNIPSAEKEIAISGILTEDAGMRFSVGLGDLSAKLNNGHDFLDDLGQQIVEETDVAPVRTDMLTTRRPRSSLPFSFNETVEYPLDTHMPSFIDINALIGSPGIRSRSKIDMEVQLRQQIGTMTKLNLVDPVSRHNARLIVQAFRAYPYMMLRRDTFPPFIHPQWHLDALALPWPIANCMSIARLYVSRNEDTASFLWRAMQSESQRCLDEVGSVNGTLISMSLTYTLADERVVRGMSTCSNSSPAHVSYHANSRPRHPARCA
jgi:hypothetical protein